MRTKSIMLLVLALGCGLIAAIGVTQVISQGEDSTQKSIETTDILVAKEDISEGRKITPQLVKVEAWPKEKVPTGAIADIQEIEGMRARSDILVDEPLRRKKLLSKGDLRTPTDHIDVSMRAVPIKIERDSNTGLIRPGDRVDVLANIHKNTQEGILHSRTITLLQNVEIFAVDDVFRVDPDKGDGEGIVAKTVTLLLTPKQAVKVDMAQTHGRLRIIMRSPDDENIAEDGEEISLSELLGDVEEEPTLVVKSAEVVVPPTLPPALNTWKMRILTGDNVADVVLEEREGNSGKKVWQMKEEDEKKRGGYTSMTQSVSAANPSEPVDFSLEPPGLDEPSEE